jgi:hypothetical protein
VGTHIVPRGIYRKIEDDMTSRFNTALDEAILRPITTNLLSGTESEQVVKSKNRGAMEDLPEAALIAAATAIFEHSVMAGLDPATRVRRWLTEADDYREIARVALAAALPYLDARPARRWPRRFVIKAAGEIIA